MTFATSRSFASTRGAGGRLTADGDDDAVPDGAGASGVASGGAGAGVSASGGASAAPSANVSTNASTSASVDASTVADDDASGAGGGGGSGFGDSSGEVALRLTVAMALGDVPLTATVPNGADTGSGGVGTSAAVSGLQSTIIATLYGGYVGL